MSKQADGQILISRRHFIRDAALGASALAALPILGCREVGRSGAAAQTGPAGRVFSLDRDWLFGGKFNPAATQPAFDDAAFAKITLPHCVSKLSWHEWDPAVWQDVWIYRRHFQLPGECKGLRVLVEFDGVMVGTTPTINGHELPQHLGGYLPSRYEITDWLNDGGNVLAVAVDSRWSQVPPEGSPKGPKSVDYLEAGGICRSVRLLAVPQVFISDLFAKPVRVLDAARRVEVTCSLDAAAAVSKPLEVQVELRAGSDVIARAGQTVNVDQPGPKEVSLTLAKLGNVKLWHVDAPELYQVVATLLVDGKPVHDYRTRIGFREARFAVDGFFLNGERLRLFGLNRHEVYPYVGYAMPRRVMRRDAEILRHEFNCNIVRCSHYPQSPAFLDACDELGLMVWEETPGWQYLGDRAWKELVVRDVRDMVLRDRNRPSIVIWGVRVNESANDPALYKRTRAVAKSLDDSRPTSGSMTPASRRHWQRDWHQDVFAFDDYHAAPDGTVGIRPPVGGVPYLLAEAVGQFNYRTGKGFNCIYRRTGEAPVQELQALRHAQAHSKAANHPRIAGVIAWCAFEYASLVNPYRGIKSPGVADVFRIPKLGATFYLAQGDPKTRPVIHPNFYWDFGPQTPNGPGKQAAVFSNCDRLELFVNGAHHATAHPHTVNYPHLKHAPFLVDLDIVGDSKPELRIDGYLGDKRVASRSFASDPAQDQLHLQADDAELVGDGTDATRLVFGRVDKYGAARPFLGGRVSLQLSGPGVIVGNNPFELADSGGMGAVWIKANPQSSGRIQITATHPVLGAKSVEIKVQPDSTSTENI